MGPVTIICPLRNLARLSEDAVRVAPGGTMRGMPIDNEWSGSMPEIYERFLVPALFTPYAAHLAQRAAAEAPATMLEVAAGTGALTRALVAVLPGARVTATDLNPAMVSWSAQRLPEADWQVADALDLPVPDASVDLIACQFGVMFVPDKIAAFTEAARVLAPQGALLCSTWGPVESSPFPAALVAALAEVLPVDPPDFVARIPHGYADPAQVAADLRAAGLLPSIEPTVLRGRAPSAAALAMGFCQGTPLRFALQARGDLAELTAAVAAAMTARLGEGPVDGDLAGFVITGRPVR